MESPSLATKRVTVRLTDSEYAYLKFHSNAFHVPPSSLLRRLLEWEMQNAPLPPAHLSDNVRQCQTMSDIV